MALVEAYIAIGGNLGDSEKIFQQAKENLQQQGILIKKHSPLYRTKAMYNTAQPDFINGALKILTSLSPQDLLTVLKEQEALAGRTSNTQQRYQPRPLDLDIIYYGDEIVETADLTIPHPLRLERNFVIQPLLDIVPDEFVDIISKQPLSLNFSFQNN